MLCVKKELLQAVRSHLPELRTSALTSPGSAEALLTSPCIFKVWAPQGTNGLVNSDT